MVLGRPGCWNGLRQTLMEAQDLKGWGRYIKGQLRSEGGPGGGSEWRCLVALQQLLLLSLGHHYLQLGCVQRLPGLPGHSGWGVEGVAKPE